MEEALAIVVGVGVVALCPFVPGLRPLAKKFVAGGLAAASTVATAAAVASEEWKDLVAEAQAERDAAAEAKAGEAETIAIPNP